MKPVQGRTPAHDGRPGWLARSVKAVSLLAVLAIAGCAPDSVGAAAAAREFRQAVADGDSPAACSFLSEQVREETAADSSCEDQLASLQLPAAAGEALQTESYGRNAMVEFRDDTVFLTMSGSGWQITGAGCVAQGESPYNCELGG